MDFKCEKKKKKKSRDIIAYFWKNSICFLEFSDVFFHVFMYFDILKTVANWTLKSNVVLFEN